MALATALPPVLAMELALPSATAAPEAPEAPELPEVAGPPAARAAPRMAVFEAVGDEVAEPVGPEAPDDARRRRPGCSRPTRRRRRWSPELLALDWAEAEPVSPLMAVGVTVTVLAPPLPPAADPVATLLPATALTASGVDGPETTLLVTEPPAAETVVAEPAAPPAPPVEETMVRLVAAPLSAVTAVETELAPVLAVELELPVARA